MDKWTGKVAVVTGVSSGIGEAIARVLVKHGVRVAGLSRRVDRMEAISTELKMLETKGVLKPIRCDITREQDVKTAFGIVEKTLGIPQIVINNAAFLENMMLTDADLEKFRQMYDTNVFGLIAVTKEAVGLMKKHKIDDGIVININSVAGHIPDACFGNVAYATTKVAALALSQSLRNELILLGTHIRVTTISPGAVKTDMLNVAGGGIVNMEELPALETQDVVDCLLFVLSTPSRVNVTEIIVEERRECILKHFNDFSNAAIKGKSDH